MSLGDHPGDEVLVSDPTIRPDLDLPDPLVELGGFELLPNAGEDVAELRNGDVARRVLVEDLEGVAELAIEGLGLHVLGHEVQEPREIEWDRQILLRDDGLQLGLGRVSSQRPHQDPKLRRGDPPIPVCVEESEGLLH